MLGKAWSVVLALVLVCFLGGMLFAQSRGGRAGRGGRGRGNVQHPEVGETLDDFELKDVKGKTVKLSDFREKIFVLELGACT